MASPKQNFGTISGLPSFRFLPKAFAEVEEAHSFYRTRDEEVATRFIISLDMLIRDLLLHPESGKRLSARTRHRLIRGFPYHVVYQPRGNDILIVGVVHCSRHPSHWKNR